MNKVLSLLLVFSMLLSFAACGSKDDDKQTTGTTSFSRIEVNSTNSSDETTTQTEGEITPNIPETNIVTEGVVTTTGLPVDIPVTDNTDDGNALENQIIEDPLGAFQHAVSRVINDGAAMFSKKTWQELYSTSVYSENDKTNSIIGSVESTIVDLMSGFFISEEDALPDNYKKGASGIKDILPLSNCSPEHIASLTCVKEGLGYRITIIMNPQTNPSKSDTDGLNVMSKDLIYMEDIKRDFTTAKASNNILREFKEGSVTYNAYFIEAVMTWDHKLISITHYCDVDMYVSVNAMYTGDLNMYWSFSTNTVYQGFVY